MTSLHDLLTTALSAMAQHRYADAAALLAPFAHVQSNELQRYYGEALRRSGRPQEAVGALMQALALKMDDVDAYLQLAFALQTLQMKVEAAECFRTVAALQPDSVMAQSYLAHGDQQCARWQDFDANLAALRAAIHKKPEDAADEFGVPFTLVGLPHEPAELLKVARMSTRFLSRGLGPLPARRAQPIAPGSKLRIGYLSGDFHAHATAALMVETLEQHDHDRFEVLLFSHGPDDGSPLQQRIRQACSRFIDVSQLDPAGIAARLRAEAVDIAVDLKGHTAGSRFTALACRPAPVQVSWLGFPGTSGADFIDYIIGDDIVTPLSDASAYSEKIAQLPGCYQPGDSTRRRGRARPMACQTVPSSSWQPTRSTRSPRRSSTPGCRSCIACQTPSCGSSAAAIRPTHSCRPRLLSGEFPPIASSSCTPPTWPPTGSAWVPPTWPWIAGPATATRPPATHWPQECLS